MKYNSFDKFGVNVYEEDILIRRKIFKSLNDAIDKVGCIVDEL